MDVGAIQPLVTGAALASVDACHAELAAILVVRGLLDAREVEVVRVLDTFAADDPSLFPQEVAAGALRVSLLAAERLRERAATAALVPELGAALSMGAITGDVWYRSCALCEVPFDHCQIHHLSWYTRGGRSDIENLIPWCSRHHHLVHEGGWALQLDADRGLIVTRPGGTVSTHDPPRARAA